MNTDPYTSEPPLQSPTVVTRLRLPYAKPVWTFVILAVNALVFVASLLLGQQMVLSYGAKENSAIVAGEVWRLVTPIFLHVDFFHIAFNSYALLAFGTQVERPFGKVRFLTIYFLSGLAGSAASFMLSPYPSVGASGAIFGLIGVVGSYIYRYRDSLAAGRSRLANVLSIIGYNLFYGFIIPAVDNWAHIGGLVAGLVLGWFMAPRYEVVQDSLERSQIVDQSSPMQWLQGLLLVVIGIVVAVAIGFIRWGK